MNIFEGQKFKSKEEAEKTINGTANHKKDPQWFCPLIRTRCISNCINYNAHYPRQISTGTVENQKWEIAPHNCWNPCITGEVTTYVQQ